MQVSFLFPINRPLSGVDIDKNSLRKDKKHESKNKKSRQPRFGLPAGSSYAAFHHVRCGFCMVGLFHGQMRHLEIEAGPGYIRSPIGSVEEEQFSAKILPGDVAALSQFLPQLETVDAFAAISTQLDFPGITSRPVPRRQDQLNRPGLRAADPQNQVFRRTADGILETS